MCGATGVLRLTDQPDDHALKGQDPKGAPGIVRAALLGLCPRCGAKGLFAGIAKFADRCPGCGLDYTAFNVGDGPAAFLTFGVGALVLCVAAWMALVVDPPLWVYVVVMVPLIFVPTLWGLRVSKGALLAAEYQRRAVEAKGEDITRP